MITTTGSIQEELQRWFMESPIHVGDGAYAMSVEDGRPSEVYPEITAYAITVATLLHARTQDGAYLDRARSAAEYMLGISNPAVPGLDRTTHYTFDTGILIDGLLTLAEHDDTHRDRWLFHAGRSLDWLASAFTDGTFPSVVPAPAQHRSDPHQWHLRQSMHLAKLAIPLLKGAAVLGEPSYERIARSLLDWALTLQADDGRLRINDSTQSTRLHPHCYALEGLIVSGAILDEPVYTNAARRGALWLAGVQAQDGSFPQWWPVRYGSPRDRVLDRVTHLRVTDAPSQAMRIWKVLGIAQDECARAERFLEGVRHERGALPLHVRSIGPVQLGRSTTYSWPTFFYLHAQMLEHGDHDRAVELF